nr:hypothetical protein [uncultured Albidiferax sp.]
MLFVECPKRTADSSAPDTASYSYYAGYSLSFAEQLIQHLPFDTDPVILDPWNGSGTTTFAAAQNGYRSHGFDLNPVMVIVAKARLVRKSSVPSLHPIWKKIQAEAEKKAVSIATESDPLRDWFTSKSVENLRQIEQSIRGHLIHETVNRYIEPPAIDNISDVASFFYVTLFRVIRDLTKPFRTSNPTWLRRPKEEVEKISVSLCDLLKNIEQTLCEGIASIERGSELAGSSAETTLTVCNSESLRIDTNSIDLVLTSPPYCTRIDYAVATSAELAILGFQKKTHFSDLRDSLMGTTTVPSVCQPIPPVLGSTCISLLDKIRAHSSVSSNTYYLKNHIRYFSSLQKSIAEIHRVLKPQGIAAFVVQDSVYKDIHNDLPTIVAEMGHALGLTVFQRDDFSLGPSISSINSRSRRYKPKGFRPTESVISFYKQN